MLIEYVVTMVLTLMVMYVEVKLTPEKDTQGNVDLRDKSVGIYFMLALLSSALILPIYFYVRRGWAGLFTGIGLAIAVGMVGGLVQLIVLLAQQP